MATKQRILAAAKRRFERAGIEGLSMRSLANDVGVTAMALYRHYPDKQAIIDALTLDALGDWQKHVEAIEADTPLEWLEKESTAFLDFALKTPRKFEAAFLLPARTLRLLPDVLANGRSPPLAIIMGHIRRAQDEGKLCDEPASEIAMTHWGLAQGLISLYRAGRFAGGEAEFRAIYRAALQRCFRSFQIERDKA